MDEVIESCDNAIALKWTTFEIQLEKQTSLVENRPNRVKED